MCDLIDSLFVVNEKMSCWCPMLLLLSIQMLNIAFLVPLSFMKLCCISEILFLLFLQLFLVMVDHP